MSIEAILISQENRDLIQSKTPEVLPQDVDVMMEFAQRFERYFIVATISGGDEEAYENWMTYPASLFKIDYNFDPDKIKTQFVEISRK